MRIGAASLEEGASGHRIPVIAQVLVDDLPVFVEAAKDILPAPRNLEQGLVHPPARAHGGAGLARRIDEVRSECPARVAPEAGPLQARMGRLLCRGQENPGRKAPALCRDLTKWWPALWTLARMEAL